MGQAEYLALEEYAIVFLIFLVVIGFGHICISKFLFDLNYKTNPFKEKDIDYNKIKIIICAKGQSGVLGSIERILYLLGFVFGYEIIIGFWLTLKTVTIWKRWEQENGRYLFNNFLIGNGLNLLYSIIGSIAIRYIQSNSVLFPINYSRIILLLLILFSPYLFTWLIHITFLKSLENKVQTHEISEEKDGKGLVQKGVTMAGKYLPLQKHLSDLSSQVNDVTLGFDEIERIIIDKLPPAAYQYRAWWANQKDGGHVHARSWMSAGWKVEYVDLGRKTVRFVRA